MKSPILALLGLLVISGFGWIFLSAPPVATYTPTPASTTAPPANPYTHGTASPDGIGKFFHDREISQVMGHPAIGWLERENREDEEAPGRAIAMMDLAPSAVVADIGAGSGYYSFRIASKVPLGRVVAVDIQPEMLEFVKKRASDLAVTNVVPHLGTAGSLELPENSLDAALMVDAYHEFSEPAGLLASLFQALKPGGRIFLLEYRAEDPDVPIKPLHKMTEAQARRELEPAGFRFVENRDGLPWQHFLVFEKPAAAAAVSP
jgi:ubiquinone/menaquinone biosynthesis C-methylase UbiE